ncbi:MAG: single-stranded DNA-binding protein [Rhodospirillales bacterium]|nr:single-stranded DNA-binding protein [Rhodospirillales bacterium]
MRHINRVQLLGYLGADPKLHASITDRSIVTFSMATTRKWKPDDGEPQEATEWHNVVAYGSLADLTHQYLKKGSAALVDGRLQTRSWTADDGTERRSTEIVARDVNFISPRPAS